MNILDTYKDLRGALEACLLLIEQAEAGKDGYTLVTGKGGPPVKDVIATLHRNAGAVNCCAGMLQLLAQLQDVKLPKDIAMDARVLWELATESKLLIDTLKGAQQ